MNATPVVVVVTAGTVALVPALRRRVVPVAKSVGHAGAGVGAAVLAGVSEVVGTAVHGRPEMPGPPGSMPQPAASAE
jgi:hypothetical protein